MRAYAHPTRMALLGALRLHGPLTATQAAAMLGESSGSCSFLLRQLAKYGLVEQAGGGRGREKPWRATAAFTSWSASSGDAELTEARRHLDAIVVEHYLTRISAWLRTRDADSPEWRRATGYGDVSAPLTAAELEALERDIDALVRPYLARVTGDEDAPPGARLVTLIHFAFPEPDGQ
jgi:predicted ArsR family transcriptional regulator